MSYLHSPRLVFTGDFRSDVSTINNDEQHYNNETFKPAFREFGLNGTNGWWNPEGGATFSFLNCTVKQATDRNGNVQPDMMIGMIVTGPAGRNAGKMVDLDPQEQGSSELWAIKLRLITAANELLFEGDLRPTAFRDLQRRQQGGISINGQPLGGTWTSVLENITWGEKAGSSPCLVELKATTQQDKLHINLNGFGYYYNHATDGRFAMGKIIGAIGPWFENEPATFTACRRLYGVLNKGTAERPAIFFGNTNFLFDKEKAKLTIDLGSSFPVADAMGNVSLTQKLVVAVSKKALINPPDMASVTVAASDLLLIGEVIYQGNPNWLNDTGGIIGFDDLSADIITLLEDHQLLLLIPSANGQYIMMAREAIDGVLVRPDNFVNRLDPGQTNDVKFYAYQWGLPLSNKAISIVLEPATADQPGPICTIPGNNFPEDGISFPASITTDKNGAATLPLTGNNINSPRVYIDGQIYTLDYQLTAFDPDAAIGPYTNDNIFIHLRDQFDIPADPVWSDIKPTMTQFSNLYPIMSKYLVDLADPIALKEKKEILLFAFTKDINDPAYMPATRDLSENKKQTILKWLRTPGPTETKDTTIVTAKKAAAKHDINTADSSKPLTDNQQRLKKAVQAKNGSGISFDEIENIFPG